MTPVDVILSGKYPAKSHASSVARSLRKGPDERVVIYLEAQKTRMIEDSDETMPFRQRRPFFYLTGCLLPDAAMIYDTDGTHEELTLFIPPRDEESVMWSGEPLKPDEAAQLYNVDKVLTTTEINRTLESIASNPNKNSLTAFSIAGQVSEEVNFKGFAVDTSALKTTIENTRVVKDEYEIALLKKANEISTEAHKAAIKVAQTASNEREIEAAIIGTCISLGCHEQSYPPIVASGESGATLHYVKNDAKLTYPDNQRKDSVLIDAGGEYQTYCADITRVIPLHRGYSKETREIWESVLAMQEGCINLLKANVSWDDVHAEAHKIAISHLLRLGILSGDKAVLFQKGISVAFFPHGLGHYLGMDTHDTGGNPNYEDENRMYRYLRVRGRLPANSVVTVEPGIYFCHALIDPYLENPETSQHINVEVLDRYWKVGGVRIEDNVRILEDGHENLTTAPKSIKDIEDLAFGGHR